MDINKLNSINAKRWYLLLWSLKIVILALSIHWYLETKDTEALICFLSAIAMVLGNLKQYNHSKDEFEEGV